MNSRIIMVKKIRLNESMLYKIIKDILNEVNVSKKPRTRGLWKSEWSVEDQTLAMYNYLYGIEDLGISKEDVAEKIIGTSVASFNMQTANFLSLFTGKSLGLDRDSKLQTYVYDKYKFVPKNEFRKVCVDIIKKRIENPDVAVTKKQLGAEIGNKRDEIRNSRIQGLINKGIPLEKAIKMVDSGLISSKPKNEPIDEPDESDNISTNTPVNMNDDYKFKEDIKSYLTPIISRLKTVKTLTDVNKLVVDLEFIIDYIDNELKETNNKEIVTEIRKIFKMVL